MKTSVYTLVIALILSSSLYAQCNFYEDYSSTTGWNQVGTEVEIINGQLEFINGAADGYGPGNATNGSQRRVYKSLGTSLNSNDTWCAEFEFTPASVGTHVGPYTGHTLLAITAGVLEPFNDCPNLPCTGLPAGTQDGIMVTYLSPTPGNGDLFFSISTKDNSAEQTSLKITANTLNTTYYLRLERTSPTNLTLSVFSDAARTTHILNSPINDTIPSTVEGLNTVQHGNIVRGDYRRELTGTIDNLCIDFKVTAGIFSSAVKESKVNIYPNPSSGQFSLSFNESTNNTQIEIYNLLGVKVFAKNITDNQMIIDISDKPKGVYLIKIINEGNVQMTKVIIE